MRNERELRIDFGELRRAFTLIELILVMGLLATLLALSAPALSGFVKGRNLQEESRRFLALTRYGRSEAASRAVPMTLWLAPKTGAYGIGPAAGFETIGGEPIEYSLADGLKFEVNEDAVRENGRAVIRFRPGGTIDEESVDPVTIAEDETHAVTIARIETGIGYEIREASDER